MTCETVPATKKQWLRQSWLVSKQNEGGIYFLGCIPCAEMLDNNKSGKDLYETFSLPFHSKRFANHKRHQSSEKHTANVLKFLGLEATESGIVLEGSPTKDRRRFGNRWNLAGSMGAGVS